MDKKGIKKTVKAHFNYIFATIKVVIPVKKNELQAVLY